MMSAFSLVLLLGLLAFHSNGRALLTPVSVEEALVERDWKNFLDSLDRYRNVRRIRIEIDTLLSLPDELGELGRLNEIVFSGTKLFDVDQVFSSIAELESVRIVRLDSVNLRTVPSSVGKLQQVKALSFRNMDSLTISSAVSEIDSLEILDLSGSVNYTVMSYDPRGRVEAVLHYTENIGFDGVYYEYNSMNMITSISMVDPFRQHITWYGYDHNGRLDTVWTDLTDIGTGYFGSAFLNFPWQTNPRLPNLTPPRPDRDQSDITYTYDDRGLVDTKRLQPDKDQAGNPGLGVTVNYEYNARGWMTDLEAATSGGNLFDMKLEFDQTGQIRKQTSQHGTSSPFVQNYDYDEMRQLKTWWRDQGGPNQASDFFDYDLVGNRRVKSLGPTGTTPGENDLYGYYPGTDGANRLQKVQKLDLNGQLTRQTDYTYDANGAIATRGLTEPQIGGGFPIWRPRRSPTAIAGCSGSTRSPGPFSTTRRCPRRTTGATATTRRGNGRGAASTAT